MDNTQVEIATIEATVINAAVKDARELADIQLALLGGGFAEVALA